jgi:tetratricopeptide (TPR) repeat protein
MEPYQPSQPRTARVPGILLLLVSAGLVAVLSSVLLMQAPWRAHVDTVPSVEDPRLTIATPYRNVRPEVHYVGDETCAQCHPDQAAHYRQHPMGRSLAPMASVAELERLEPSTHNPFEAFGLHFLVERRGQSIRHKQVLQGSQGQPLAESALEVHYAIGSGTRGRTYFTSADGYLFRTPISWFSQKGIWDVSPGYSPQVLSRRSLVECMFCHTNYADWVEHSLNHFRPPIFRGYAIGCERCHGPGELHVQRQERGEVVVGLDDTIVNPSRLDPLLREAVCQQCHLEGSMRILRRGRGPFDYRPGLPLHLFWAVFVEPPQFTDNHRAVSHVEQMYVSRCFRDSKGRLGCISCHEPHRVPAAAEKVEHYRTRCLSCHAEQSCRLAMAERRAQQPQDSCSACHMPRFDSSDIAHTAITDHRILRRSEPAADPRAPIPRLLLGELPMFNFYREQAGPEDTETRRDLAMALIEKAWQPTPAGQRIARIVLPWLEAAVQAAPEDVPALADMGYALWLQGRAPEALAVFEKTLSLAPEQEITLIDAARVTAQLKQPEKAIAYFRRASAMNPWGVLYRYELAQLLAQRDEWAEALEQCQTLLRLYPGHLECRQLLITGYLRTGKKEQAQAEFEKVLANHPPDRERTLRQWFAEQAR